MSEFNSSKYKSCPLRCDAGNCLPLGGFCTAVKPEICDALHQAYDHGKADGLLAAVKHYAEEISVIEGEVRP